MTERIPTFSEVWTRPELWPFDLTGALFLGKALNLIGEAVSGKWEGVEFGLMPFSPPALARLTPLAIGTAAAEQQDSKSALNRADPEVSSYAAALISAQLRFQAADKLLKISSAQPHHVVGRRGFAFSASTYAAENMQSGWEAARAEVTAASAAFQSRYFAGAALLAQAEAPYAERLDSVRRLIIPGLINGQLKAWYASAENGQPMLCDAGWWNADHDVVCARFLTCKVDPQAPMRLPVGPVPASGRWLFLDHNDLTAFLMRLESENAPWWPAARGITLTDWSRTGGPADLEARRRLKAGGNSSPAESHITDELAEMWNKAHPGEKPTTGKSIATLRGRPC